MLNIIDLESRWLHYKLRSYFPYLIFIILITIFVSLLLFFLSRNEKPLIETHKEGAVAIQIETQDIKTLPSKIITHEIANEKEPQDTTQKEEPKEYITENHNTEKKSPSRVFTPSMSFIHEINNEPKSHYDKRIFKAASPISPQIKQTFEEENINNLVYNTEEKYTEEKYTEEEYVEEEYTETYIAQKNEPIQSKKITIKRQDIEEDIAGIIVRFKKNNNPALSLFIAKRYYELGDYHNAYNYALITNDLNRDIETSWLIFSKSLVKLGKKTMATKTLKEYISYSKSKSAKILLDEIESGKFK